MKDIDVAVLAECLRYLEPHLPITDELDRWGTKGWYKTQKSHMVLWIDSQSTKGSANYTRSEPNSSAKRMYNRFLNPGGLLWMLEALGEDEATLRRAAKAAADAEDRAEGNGVRARAAAFRRVIPFERVLELYNSPRNWKYDKLILPILSFDEEGRPVTVSSQIWAILERENA